MKNKIPQPKTIARHYIDGKLCDYPAEAVFSAINSFDYNYNSVSIPIQPTFGMVIYSDFEAFVYLSNHNSETEVAAFLANPDDFMSAAGVRTVVHIDENSAYIMASLVEPEMLDVLRHGDFSRLFDVLRETNWEKRHTRKFHKGYCTTNTYFGLDDNFKGATDINFEQYGFCKDFDIQLDWILFLLKNK
jgi:hypothetical protein